MKRIFVLFLILSLTFVLASCNSNEGGNNSKGDKSQSAIESQGEGGSSSSQGSSSATNSTTSSIGQQSGNTTSSQGSVNPGTSQGGTSANTSVDLPSNGEISTQGQIKIISSYGGMETAYVTFEDAGVSGYAAYYKATNGSYKKVDNELIREYSSFWRVDVLGLSAGDYEIKIVPVDGAKENDSAASCVKVKTISHKREGFAFSSASPNKTASGAYNDDGTLKSDAKVLYITKDNINSVTLDVIKNKKGETQTGVGLVDIMYLRGKGYDKTPLALRFIGKISASDITWTSANVTKVDPDNYINVKGCFNTTVEGVGNDATCHGWSFKLRDANNIEVRNFGLMLFVDDGITVDTDNFNIWIHNNDFFYGGVGGDADQAKGDGSCDNKKSNYLTVSYNHFWDSGKAILCGMDTETSDIVTTFHHNWFDHSDSRHPRIRIGSTHVYNNFYDGVSKYGIGATMGSSCFAESNYFLNTKKPILSSLQGTDAMGAGTFSGETGGIVKAYGNIFDKTSKPIDYSSNNKSFDCYTVTNAKDTVPANVKTLSGATSYNNFDTASSMYKYVPDDASIVPEVVRAYSGRVGGGDFKWTFTDADNSSYAVITALKTAINNYQSSLVSVGGVNN